MMVDQALRARLAVIERLAPPPARPFGIPVDWRGFASQNGFLPPADFMALVDRYGTGWFSSGCGELAIDEVAHPMRTYIEGNAWERENLLGAQRQFPTLTAAWPIYPATGGYLPLGSTDVGWTVGWLTTGDPGHWRLAIDGGRGGWWADLPIGIVEFVGRWLRADLGLPEAGPFEVGPTAFQPHREHAQWHGRIEDVEIAFAAGMPGIRDFARDWHDAIAQAIRPATLISLGERADARTPLHAEMGVRYRTADEASVVSAIERLAAALGTPVESITALDGSPGWPGQREAGLR